MGHGPWAQGDYGLWLQRDHPQEWAHLQTTPPTPSPLGAEECGTYPLAERLHHTAYVADRTIAYPRGLDKEDAFFLVCSFPDPHHPYCPPAPWDRMYAPAEVVPPVQRAGELDDLPPHMRTIRKQRLVTSGRGRPTEMSDEHRREIIAHTYGMVSLIDHHVGNDPHQSYLSSTVDHSNALIRQKSSQIFGVLNIIFTEAPAGATEYCYSFQNDYWLLSIICKNNETEDIISTDFYNFVWTMNNP